MRKMIAERLAIAIALTFSSGVAWAQASLEENECFSQVAKEIGADDSQMKLAGTEDVGEGTAIHVMVDGTIPWTCYVDGNGVVTSIAQE